MNRIIRNSHGFTLLELLSVIAMIAILAGLIFPVMNSVQEKARQGKCISNLREISTALHQFRADEECYPEHLLYTEVDSQGNTRWIGLYPYLSNLDRYNCPNNTTRAPKDTSVNITTLPGQEVTYRAVDGSSYTNATVWLYLFDSYDGIAVGSSYTVHYQTLRLPKAEGGNDNTTDKDYTRQLRFKNPPDDTLVTYCSYHKPVPDYSFTDTRNPLIMLWLSGHVSAVNNSTVSEQLGATPTETDAWRIKATN